MEGTNNTKTSLKSVAKKDKLTYMIGNRFLSKWFFIGDTFGYTQPN
jgi:hypothetical protein